MLTRNKKAVSIERLLPLYEKMVLIRMVEKQLVKLFADGEIPGFIHLSIGQEAVATGVISALKPQDTIATTHRGHGHVIAKGIVLDRFFMEIMGRAGGICGGRSGSMHVADMSVGVLGANGIVGAGIPIALGSALAHQVRQTGGIATVFFGDGAQAEGVLHESFNLAALWKLPLLFVCENNGWSEFSPASRQFSANLGVLAQAFGLTFARVDGNDVVAVAKEAEIAAGSLREGGLPRVLECMTRRVRGHYEGDPQKYRDAKELLEAESEDPIARAAKVLRAFPDGEAELRAAEERASLKVEEAVRRAREAPLPDFFEAKKTVYTPVREG